MSRFILMLTKNDRTVPDALEVYRRVRTTHVRNVGFKDIGLPFENLVELTRAIKSDHRTVMLEVVSATPEAELASIEAAARLSVDYVLGGRNVPEAVKILRGTGIKYFPFAGRTIGHPTQLSGTADQIVEDAIRLAGLPGVDGLDLLAYRFAGDVPDLIKRVTRSVALPVIVAGSIDGPMRLGTVLSTPAWGFTIGSALFDEAYPVDPLISQIDAIMKVDGVIG